MKNNENPTTLDDIPIIDANAGDFKEQFDFALWSTQSCSDYRNDRERPYNGPPHTDHGKRGEQLVEGLTMRDLVDCLIKAMLVSGPSERYMDIDTYAECWDFSTDPPTATQFLLDHQDEPDFVSTKVETDNWRYQDIYKLNWDNIDPMAVTQNFACEIEKMMGIFPNVPPLIID